MYSVLPSFVLGFHGCDASIAEKVFAGSVPLEPSENEYDWLGHGIYFWENSPERALEWAKEREKIREPAVVGAIIDLRYCFNLLDAKWLNALPDAYESIRELTEAAGEPMVKNSRLDAGGRTLLRPLDCLVINHLHKSRYDEGLRPFDSVRSAFVEDEPVYEGSGIDRKNHIQIAVRNPHCIKGYFRPLKPPELPEELEGWEDR